MHLAYIWIVSHLSAKSYQNCCRFDEVLTKTNLLSFLGHGVDDTMLRRTVEVEFKVRIALAMLIACVELVCCGVNCFWSIKLQSNVVDISRFLLHDVFIPP